MFSELIVYAGFYIFFVADCFINDDPRRGCPDLSSLAYVLGKALTGRKACRC